MTKSKHTKPQLHEGDTVKLKVPYKNCQYGVLDYFEGNKWCVSLEDIDEFDFFAEDEFEYVPPYVGDEQFVKNVFTYTFSADDIAKLVVPAYNFTASKNVKYNYTLDDVVLMLNNILAKKPNSKQLSSWADFFYSLDDHYEVSGAVFDPSNDFFGFNAPLNDAAMAYSVVDAITKEVSNNFKNSISIDFAYILQDINRYKQKQPVKVYMWTSFNKRKVMSTAVKTNCKNISDEYKDDLRKIILQLANEGDTKALDVLGYSYYGGNDMFPCNWQAALECFLKLMDSTKITDKEKCIYANTLGYIYYYGRCNNGVPQYEQAFKYFSLGAAGGVYESVYKLSDMYAHGYYVKKNKYAVNYLLGSIYNENYKHILQEHFDCPFADLALRMGNLCRDGLIEGDSFYYYTLAEFAIKKRLKYNSYGDIGVYLGIEKELAKIRSKRHVKKLHGMAKCEGMPSIVNQLLDQNSCSVSMKNEKDLLKITITRLPNGNKKAEKVLECYPYLDYCNLVDSVTLYVSCKNPIAFDNVKFTTNQIKQKKTKNGYTCSFLLCGAEQKTLEFAKTYRKFSRKNLGSQQKYNFVSVVFKPGGRQYDYICEIDGVSVGDKVIVLANGEEKEVEVVNVFSASFDKALFKSNTFKKVIRKS